MPLLSLGNVQLDQVLGGGIEEERCTILAGEPGSGKTALALQFITDPSVSHLPCAYICIDKRPEKIMEKAIQMNESVNNHIQSGHLKFVEISIQEWDREQPINELLLTIQLQVDALFRNFNAKRVIIDSILPNSLIGFSAENKQYFMRDFLQIIHTYPTTSLGLLYDVSAHHSLWLDTNIISDQLIFQRKADLDYVTYWLEVSKNNNANKSGRYRFTINDEKGIKLKHRLC